ncbi:hypothetical protein [Clostridium sp.]|uniref:hypothetical protein n=1 Tax=Clostridium sp. TaxID=1506 RepID=UPI003216E9EF
MDNKYYKVFGIRESCRSGFTIRCNTIMKELSCEFRRYSDNELVQIAINLTDDDIEYIKPYIKVKDFERYRGKENKNSIFMSYLDGWTMEFEGITGSEIPILKLSSDDYAFNIQPPVEKLYLFLRNEYFRKDKKYKRNHRE